MPPTTLGKRKRVARADLARKSHSPSPSASASESDSEDLQAIFRRAFEAKFAPLPSEPKQQKSTQQEEEELEQDEALESDWSGISTSDDDETPNKPTIEVIEHTNLNPTHTKASRAELRSFMTSKPPKASIVSTTNSPPPGPKQKSTPDANDSEHLKNDLALQRLLRDSHLLSTIASTSSQSSAQNPLTLTGALRHKSTDLHLLSLGAKTSIHHQKNMPLPERRNNKIKAVQAQEKRRTEARENGIVLEREKKVRKLGDGKGGKRERGVGEAAVGKFRGGTLTLSRRDVASITSSGGRDVRGGRGGKGSGRGSGRGRGGKR